ncbi:MAG: S8 family serine peptidase [Caldilineaceae bacterium]
MAAPHVAGLAALIKSQHPDWSAAYVEECILSSADNIDAVNPDYEDQLGAGRINAFAAVSCPDPSPTTTPTATATPSATSTALSTATATATQPTSHRHHRRPLRSRAGDSNAYPNVRSDSNGFNDAWQFTDADKHSHGNFSRPHQPRLPLRLRHPRTPTATASTTTATPSRRHRRLRQAQRPAPPAPFQLEGQRIGVRTSDSNLYDVSGDTVRRMDAQADNVRPNSVGWQPHWFTVSTGGDLQVKEGSLNVDWVPLTSNAADFQIGGQPYRRLENNQ